MHAIGFVGVDARKTARLYEKFIKYVTQGGVQKDQDHPPAIVIGLSPETKEASLNSYKLVQVLGATKIIVTSDSLSEKEIKEIQDKLEKDVKIFALKEKEKEFKASSSPDSSNELTLDNDSTRGISSKRNNKTQKLQELFNSILNEYNSDPDKDKQISEGGFSYLGLKEEWKESEEEERRLLNISKQLPNKDQIVGVIGGAGVLTGIDFSKLLVEKHVKFILLSDTTAPDKNNAVKVGGKSFSNRYLSDIQLLRNFAGNVAIPCNTAHIKKGEFVGDFLEENQNRYAKLVDIGDATLSKCKELYPDQEKIIILATPATTQHEKSAYNYNKLKEYGIDLIKPSDEQLTEIHRAIYEIKGFKSTAIIDAHRRGEDISQMQGENIEYEELAARAKGRILKVIDELRKENDVETPVILGCTELPIVFTQQEMVLNSLISSTRALASSCQTRVNNIESKIPSNFPTPTEAVIFHMPKATKSNYQNQYDSESSDGEEYKQYEKQFDKQCEFFSKLKQKYDISYLEKEGRLKIYFEQKDKLYPLSKTEFFSDAKQIETNFNIDKSEIKVHNRDSKYISIDNKSNSYIELFNCLENTDCQNLATQKVR